MAKKYSEQGPAEKIGIIVASVLFCSLMTLLLIPIVWVWKIFLRGM